MKNSIVFDEIALKEQNFRHTTVDATSSGFNGPTTNGHTIETQRKSGYLLYQDTLKQPCHLEDLKLMKVFTDHSKQKQAEVILNSPGIDAGDCETHCDDIGNSG